MDEQQKLYRETRDAAAKVTARSAFSAFELYVAADAEEESPASERRLKRGWTSMDEAEREAWEEKARLDVFRLELERAVRVIEAGWGRRGDGDEDDGDEDEGEDEDEDEDDE